MRLHVDMNLNPELKPPETGTHTSAPIVEVDLVHEVKHLTPEEKLKLHTTIVNARRRVFARDKAHTFVRKQLDGRKERMFEDKILVQCEETMRESQDWKKRKVAVDNYVDIVIERMGHNANDEAIKVSSFPTLLDVFNP